MDIDTLLAQFHSLVDVNKTSLLLSLLAISFNPIAWNIVARNGTWHPFFFFFGSCQHSNAAHLYLWTEHRNKSITRIFGGNARFGCYFLAFMIFSFGILRDKLYVLFDTKCIFSLSWSLYIRYVLALLDQPQKALLPEEYSIIVPAALFITGQTFVVTSTWALGITGTFLGDYFGILMDHRVEGYVSSSPLGNVLKFIHSSLH